MPYAVGKLQAAELHYPAMRERVAQMVLLVRAFEEADPEGLVLSREQRLAASRRAVMVTTRDEGEGRFCRKGTIRNDETIERRARLLYNALIRRIPSLPRVLAMTRLRSAIGPGLVVAAFLVGLATNLPVAGREINLLAFPLLGLLTWNLCVYVLSALIGMLRRRARRDRATRLASKAQDRVVTGLADWVVRVALWRSRIGWRRDSRGVSAGVVRVTSRAFTRFCALWHRLTGELLEARVRRRMHLGAMALALGVLAGMYWRALAFEYRATWESTLLDAGQVQALLDVVLGPAAWLSGIAVPDVAPLQAPLTGDAAPWIHLWALTTALVVLIPRALLALVAAWRSWRLRSNLPVDLDEPYFRRALADWRGAARRVRIAPYSFSPPPATLESLKALLYDFFGTRADIEVHSPLPYGDDGEILIGFIADGGDAETDDRAESYLVLLFNLAQSPEAEVHGALLERMTSRLDAEHGRLLVVVDVSGYGQHADPSRVEERVALWRRIARDAGLALAEIDPGRLGRSPTAADSRIAELRAALWPSGDVVPG